MMTGRFSQKMCLPTGEVPYGRVTSHTTRLLRHSDSTLQEKNPADPLSQGAPVLPLPFCRL
jgi:hypothetical protein